MRHLLANRWHSGWLAAWSAAVLVWAANAAFGLCDSLEQAWGQQLRQSVAVTPSPDLVVVRIDDASLAALGAWPWPRELHARLIDRLTAAGVRRIVHTAPFVGAESRQALSQLERIASAMNEDRQGADRDRLLGLVQQSQVLLDGDGQLALSITQSQRTVLAVRAQGAAVVDWPPAQLSAGATGVGHGVFVAEPPGLVRAHALNVSAGGRVVPSLAVWALRDATAADWPNHVQPFWRPQGEHPGALQLSAAAVINGALPTATLAQLAGKTVLVGATTAVITPALTVTDAGALYPVEALAQVASALASRQWITTPRAQWLPWGIGAAILLYLWLLPRFSAAAGWAVTALLTVLLLATSQVAMTLQHVELTVVVWVVSLLAGHAGWWVARRQPHTHLPAGAHIETPTAAATPAAVLEEPAAAIPADDVPTQPTPDEPTTQPATQPTPLAPYALTKPVPLALSDLPPLDSLSSKVGAASLSSAPLMTTPSAPVVAPAGATVKLPRLGRFQLLRELGRGAMGRVYLGEDVDNRGTFAIKTLALSREFEGVALREARQRFKREAVAALRLRHPGIVRVIDAGEDQGYAWIAMEVLHGHDLVRHTQPTQLLQVPEVLAICACIADALAHAHAQGVVHRDIKPANVMYEPRNGEVKVTDFGIARISDAARTRTGLLFGSPSYMSPEHLAGGQVDGRSDIYSLGVLLFQLLTGVLPLNGRSMAELMQAVAQQPAPDVRSLRPRLPEAVANIVALALEKRPELRYASAADMAADLRSVRALWQASASTIPTERSVDGSIQRSVHDVAAARPAPPVAGLRTTPVGQNQPG